MNPQNSQEALAQLQSQQSSAQNLNDILGSQREQLGVTGAQDTVKGLRGAINNTTKLLQSVAPSVMGRTGSSLVTSAQAGKQIQNEQAPISQNLSSQSTEYNQSAQDLAELQQKATEAASGIYQGQQDKLSFAQNLYNTLYQREQAAEAARQAELDRQEQIRQFNEQLTLSKKSAAGSGGGGFNLSGGAGGSAALGGKAAGNDEQKAYNALRNDIFNGKSTASGIIQYYNAIAESARRGNAYDALKVQILQQAKPGLFGKNGVDANRIRALAGQNKLNTTLGRL